MRPFRELRVWREAHSLTLRIYPLSRTFPRDEQFALAAQMRRAAASIPTNIAEGSARGDNEFAQFLRIALGSAAELEYQLILAHDLGYLAEDLHADLTDELTVIKRRLQAFRRTVRSGTGAQLPAQRQRPTANGQRRVPAPGAP